MNLLIGYMYAAIVLDHAHLTCPIALAWGNPRFRKRMFEQPDKFILLPALCVLIPFAIGSASLTTQDPVFSFLVVTYTIFNAYHFGAQNWGVCALLGGSINRRCAAFTLTILPLILLPIWWKGLLWLIMIDLSISAVHWAQDLRLSSFVVSRQWLFTVAMLIAGGSGFIFETVKPGGVMGNCFQMLACTHDRQIPVLLGLRFGLGFWHQLMSRWVWSSEGRELLV